MTRFTVDSQGAAQARQPAIARLRQAGRGFRMPRNWIQFAQFAIVGATGYAVNLATFSVLVDGVGFNYLIAATGAFAVAVTNNFLLNRYWTFSAGSGHAGRQAGRFLLISLLSLGLNLVVLHVLVGFLQMGAIAGQAVAVVSSTPVNFLGNKLWTFRSGTGKLAR